MRALSLCLVVTLVAFAWPVSGTAGDTVRLRLTASPDPELAPVTVELKEPAERQSALAHLRLIDFREYDPAYRRPGISDEDCREALALARHELDWLTTEASRLEAPEGEDRDALVQLTQQLLPMLVRLFTALGDMADSARLASCVRGPWPGGIRLAAAQAAAYIEAREGRLKDGELVALVRGADDAAAGYAARALAFHGIREGDARVAALVRSGHLANRSLDHVVPDFLPALFGAPPAVALEPMRAAFSRGRVDPPNIMWWESTAALYLLAHGTAEDRKLVESAVLASPSAAHVAHLCADPRPILYAQLYQRRFDLALDVLRASPLPAHEVAELAEECQSLAWVIGSRVSGPIGDATDAQAKGWKLSSELQARITEWVPDATIAQLFHQRKVNLVETPWIPPSIWKVEEIIAHFAQNDASPGALALLDYVPPDEVRRQVTRAFGDSAPIWLELWLSAQRCTTRGWSPPGGAAHPGQIVRPCLLGSPQESQGAVSCVTRLTHTLEGRKLSFWLKLDMAPYYHRGDFISGSLTDAEFEMHAFIKDGGRKMAGAVRVTQRGKTCLVSPGTDRDGALGYVAELPEPTLAGVQVVVEPAFDKNVHPWIFDLFALGGGAP